MTDDALTAMRRQFRDNTLLTIIRGDFHPLEYLDGIEGVLMGPAEILEVFARERFGHRVALTDMAPAAREALRDEIEAMRRDLRAPGWPLTEQRA